MMFVSHGYRDIKTFPVAADELAGTASTIELLNSLHKVSFGTCRSIITPETKRRHSGANNKVDATKYLLIVRDRIE